MNCPLCKAPLHDAASYAAHLNDVHGLVDDPGSTTTMPTSPPLQEPGQPWYSNVQAPFGTRMGTGRPPTSWLPPPPLPQVLPPPPRKHAAAVWVGVGVGALIVVIILGLVLRPSSGSSSSSPSGAFTTVPTTAPLPDPAKFAAVNVQPTDLPAGWTNGQQPRLSATSRAVAVAAFSCLGVQLPDPKRDVRSYTYLSPDQATRVASQVTFADVDSQHDYEAALAAKGAECLEAGLPGVFAQPDSGITVESVDVTAAGPVVGADEGTVFNATITLDEFGRRVDLKSDIYSFRVGPLVVDTAITADASVDTTALADTVIQAQLARAHALVG